MQNVRFTLETLDHISGVHLYISKRSARTAARVVRRIFVEELAHRGMLTDPYEHTVPGPSYVIVHEIAGEDRVIVLAVPHGAEERCHCRGS
jgi:plasmid stabilization system protein ParE